MYFDAHSDIWVDITAKRLLGEKNVFDRYHLERLKKGGIEGSMFVIWVDPPYDVDYVARTNDIMRCVEDELKECNSIKIVYNYDQMMQARKDGYFYVFKGLEGMAAAHGNLDMIDTYYNWGARHGMLTWNEENEFGAGANTGLTTGLTDAGKKAVKKMQDMGMIVDTSHLNEAGFWDICKISTKPIIASHSNARALCDMPRNLTDDQLRAIRDLDGVVGLNSFNLFVSKDTKEMTVEKLAEHAAHMIDVMGIEHVGCGFDFFEFCSDDSMDSMDVNEEFPTPAVKGMKDCSEVPNLFKVFEKMGMTKEEMNKIAYENFHNVIKKTIG